MAQSKDTRHMHEPDDQNALSVPEGSLQPGQVLQNRYRVLGVIGVGGMGAVYQARDLHFEDVPRLCAVKEMINIAQDQNLREQTIANFKREASLLATLSHPAIPQIFDFFSFGDRAYLVMEFIQGKDLEAILNSTTQLLPTDQVVRWGIEVCDVLAYLHGHEPEPIIFRDMKPSNIMIDHHKRVRLIDFGIAKTFQMGQPGTMIGTEGYSPPEQYKGEATPAADVYALAASMHHLLTRRDPRLEPPFSFDQKPMQSYNSELPEELTAVVMRALSYDPKERYSSASAMKQSLEAVISGNSQAVVAPAPPPPTSNQIPAAAPPVQQPVTPSTPVQDISPPAHSVATAPSQVHNILPLWSFQVEDAVRSTPIVVNDVVYVGSYDNNLWAIDAKSGDLKWKYATEGGIGSSPAYAGGSIFIGSIDNKLYAIDALSGTKQWSFSTGSKIYTTPRAVAGLVIFGSDDGHLYVIKPVGSKTAREVWKYNLMYPVRCSPGVYDEHIYIGNDNGDFVCVNFAGERRWRFGSRRRVLSSPVVRDGVVYFGSDDWHLYALEIERGMTIWRYRTGGAVISSPAYGDNKVVVGSADGNVYAIEALNGRQSWSFNVGVPVTSSPCINRDSVYIGAADGALYCLHLKSGELLWRFQSGGPILSSPHVEEDVVYIGSDDKRVYALPG